MSAAFLPDILFRPSAFHISDVSEKHTETTQTPPRTLRSSKSLSSILRRPRGAIGGLSSGVWSSLGWKEDSYSLKESRRQVLYLNLRNATRVEEWRTAATELDELEGNNAWKYEDASADYDHALVAARLKQLEDARISCDPQKMLFIIRTALTRHLGGMGCTQLYTHSHVGTKDLIERYINSALDTMSSLLELTNRPNSSGLDSRHLLEQILAARQAFGRSALLLSGGGTLGMYHNGVVKALWEAKLLPRLISGSSAGSIVCAVLCTHTDEVLPTVVEEFCYGDLDVFTERGVEPSPLQHVTRFLKHGSLYDIAHLMRVMKNLIGDLTFQEAYNRTRRILNICVSSAGLYELPRLLNYVTAPNVIIWSAVAASCSVPLVFSPASLYAKDPRTGEQVPWNPSEQHWIDGSVDSDLPMTQLAELFNVNHFIVSQVNPHVVPFLTKDDDIMSKNPSTAPSKQVSSPGVFSTLANLARDEAIHRLQVMSELGVFPNLLTKLKSVVGQRYSGDVTIFPEIPYSHFLRILQNPTTDFILQATLCGEQATWPKLSRIQNHCAIELALDDAVQQLRARIAFSPSQVNLRLNVVGRPHSRAGSDTARSKRSKSFRTRRKFSDRVTLGHGPKMAHPDVLTNTKSASNITRQPVTFSLTPTNSMPSKVSQDVDDSFSSSQETESSSETPESDHESHDDSSSSDDERTDAPKYRKKPRRLFPHATQPNTPLPRNNRSSDYFLLSRSGRSTPPMNALSMTMSNGGLSGMSNSPPRSRKQSSTNLGNNPHTFPLDISGTLGMTQRKRRSMSTELSDGQSPLEMTYRR